MHSDHYINGHWIAGAGPAFTSINPANDQVIWEGRHAVLTEVQAAFDAAKKSLPAWSCCTLQARQSILKRFKSEVEKCASILAKDIAEETGKPLWEAKTEVSSVINKVDLAITAYQSRTSEQHFPDASLHLRYHPMGVVAVLGAFNFPAHLSHGHIIPALLAGNTIIYKPSELTPKVAVSLLACWEASGLPPGVLNVVQGDAKTASHLIHCPIQALYFTGSYQTGKILHAYFHDRPEVLLVLEMGGNNPLIIGDIHDLQAASYMILLSSFITAGQRCSCARRLILPHTPQSATLLQVLIQAIQRLRIGPFTDQPEPFIGPVIRRSHALAHLKKQEALIQLGGKPHLPMTLQGETGAFLTPGLIDMHHVQHVPDEECFAPLLQVYQYETFEEALQLANNTAYGLTAGLLSDNLKQYAYFCENIRAGVLSWNRPTTGASSHLPFGGIGRSGNYRPSGYFAADYCAYPVASIEQSALTLPETLLPGISS